MGVGMVKFLVVWGVWVFVFGVGDKGSLVRVRVGGVVYMMIGRGMGVVMWRFMKREIGGILGRGIMRLMGGREFWGMMDGVGWVEGGGGWMGEV